MNIKKNGFTLVELAIALMVIGLLIGGVLKGQELIENAKVASYIRQVRSYDAAVMIFQSGYDALPGDIVNPAARLPECAAANCSISGDGDHRISAQTTQTDEANTFWLHLGAAGLISGVDMNSTWTSPNYTTGFAMPSALGGVNRIIHYDLAPNTTTSLDGRYGHHFFNSAYDAAGQLAYVIPTARIGQLDHKIDDGHPFKGNVKVHNSGSGINYGEENYDSILNSNVLGSFVIQTGF